MLEIVTGVDPAIPAATVIDAIRSVTSRAGQRRQLAWALNDHPELLTGAGAQAPVPSVLQLIDALIDVGARGIVRPPCPRCGRVITLNKILDGVRVCRNCRAKFRTVTCSRCGARREPATRDGQGRPLCPHCLSTDAANQEPCVGCQRRRPVSVRTPDGPLCASCRPLAIMTCSICDRSGPAVISQSHWASLVPGMPATAGTVHRLRQCPARARRYPRRPALRHLHPPRPVLLARLPRMRRAHRHPFAPMRPLHTAATVGQPAAR